MLKLTRSITGVVVAAAAVAIVTPAADALSLRRVVEGPASTPTQNFVAADNT